MMGMLISHGQYPEFSQMDTVVSNDIILPTGTDPLHDFCHIVDT